MTYMPESNLSSAPVDAETSTFEKLKTLTQEGVARTQRISKILRQAFSETREEFQAGRTVISPLAKEVTTETVSTFKTKSQQAAEAVNKAWKDEADAPDTTERLVSLIKKLAKTAQTTLFPTVEKQVKQQAVKLDDILSDRYGSQYTTLRNRFERVRSWVTVSEPTDTDTVNSQAADVIEVESTSVK